MSAIPTEKPDWVEETPYETSYNLIMMGEDGGHLQDIELTRTEFIALKGHLAELRGLQEKHGSARETAVREELCNLIVSFLGVDTRKDAGAALERAPGA